MQKINVCLLFGKCALEAVNFYASIFSDCKILSITHAGANEYGGPEGSVRTVAFQLFGQDYLAVNGGSHFTFNDAVSLMINCDTQKEIDDYWEKFLAHGGREVECGWLVDQFGMRWQVVPRVLGAMMSDPDEKKSQKVMQAIFHMKKLDISELEKAYRS